MNAYVFGIQPFSIHDGPGIRTTVFLKGCPLQCKWCHNPESHSVAPDLFFYKEKCTGCGLCVNSCGEHAIKIENDVSITDRKKCTACGKCVECCVSGARELVGQTITIESLMKKIEKDKMFYKNTGGVTISGGEPLMHHQFVKEIIRKCREIDIHVAIETCGYADSEVLRDVIQDVDLVLYDLKIMDEKLHKEWTGVSNALILKNAEIISKELHKEMVVRIPVISGVNATKENMMQTVRFIKEKLNQKYPVHLLPYHSLGESKRERLEKSEGVILHAPDEQRMEQLKNVFVESGITAQIGGSM